MRAWYVAKTKPSKERCVETYLSENWGVEVFLPIVHRPAGRKSGCEPLFPTYLFCFVDPRSADWPAIRWAPGLLYFLGIDHEPIPVPGEVVAHLKERVAWWNQGGYSPRFSPGEQVLVSSGPLAGLNAIFQRYVPARQRCQVLLQLLGQLTMAELPVEALQSMFPYRSFAFAT